MALVPSSPVLFISLALLALPASVEAQLCKSTETVDECVNRLLDANGSVEGATRVAAATAPKNTETGVFDSANGLSSSVKDFLPVLQLSGFLGPIQNGDESGIVTVALNPMLTGKNKHTQLRALLNTQGKLYGPLKAELTDEVAEALEKKLTTEKDRQNLTVEFAYNYTSARLGRDYTPYDGLLGDLLVAASTRPDVAAANLVLANAARTLARTMRDHGIEGDDVFALFESKRPIIEPVIAARVAASRAADASLGAVIRVTGLNRFGGLVTNRPQLHFSASHSWLDPLYGPNSFRVRATYEAGVGQGFNTFLAAVKAKSLDCEEDGDRCLIEFQRIATTGDVNANLKAGSRFSVFAEVQQFGTYNAPEGLLLFTSERVTTFAAGATLGRLIAVDDKGVAQGRLDLAIKWERPLERSVAKDHATASITFTKKIGDISVPFGLVWASRPGLLDPESYDHGVTARVGLKFNLFPSLR